MGGKQESWKGVAVPYRKRYPDFVIRKAEGCSLSRATSFNKHAVMQFHNKLERVLDRHQCFRDGSRLFNLDETCTSTVPGEQKLLAIKGTKQVSQCTSSERGTTLLTCCIVGAAGEVVPLVMVFLRVFKPHMLAGAFPGTLGLATKSGWMTSELFPEVIKHFVKRAGSSKEKPSLLFADNHESHLSIQSVQIAKDKGVTIMIFPPHTTHKLQPLDKTMMGLLKHHYRESVNHWMRINPGHTFSIYNVAGCSNDAICRSLSLPNIWAGFRTTGIFPFNPSIFTDADFKLSSVTDRPPPAEDSNPDEPGSNLEDVHRVEISEPVSPLEDLQMHEPVD